MQAAAIAFPRMPRTGMSSLAMRYRHRFFAGAIALTLAQMVLAQNTSEGVRKPDDCPGPGCPQQRPDQELGSEKLGGKASKKSEAKKSEAKKSEARKAESHKGDAKSGTVLREKR